ncbi:MAG: hypothetical protein LBC59_01795 [Chitinispirillales bacterium]|jgi:hypothetical protein|nr:hypothetical protein [Chitinispirillales bacterium]
MMCRVKKSIVLALAVVGVVFAQSAAPRWQNIYPAYNGLAFDGSTFVAVSGDGLIRTTVDGETWQNSAINDDEGGNSRRIYAVAYGAGQFVALQNSSKYLHSGNGFVWASDPTALPSNVPWKHIVYGIGSFGWEFVAVAADGVTGRFDEDYWERVSSGAASLSHAAYGAGKFAVVGDGIKWSGDAFAWGGTSGASGQIAVAAFGEGKFVALSKNGANAYTSEDAQSWTSVSASGAAADMTDMVFGGGKFVAVGKAGKGCYSSNGTSWTSFTLNENDDFTAVKYGTNSFLALGAKGSVYKSANGESWTPLYGNSVTSYKQIAFGNGKYVAVGDSGVSVSSDGIKWERKSSAKNLTGVAFGANKFVAVSDNGVIISSGDGNTWTDHNIGEAVFTSVAFGGTTFIAGGRTPGMPAQSQVVIYTSANGADWSGYAVTDLSGWQTSGEYIASLCSSGDKFIAAVGGGATKALKECAATGSNVGRYWSSVPGLPDAADGYPMTSAVYVNDKFVVLGVKATGDAVLINSDNGTSWTPIAIPNIKGLRAATYAKSHYFAVGDSGGVYAHMSGSWIQQGKGTTNRNLSTVYSDNNAIIAAGVGGVILHSTAEPTSVKHASTPRAASSKGGVMRLSRLGRASTVTLSFTPNSAGAIAVYSLSGRQLYKARLGAGERSARLPERVMSNGSVIVRYTGDGRVVSQRFQLVR